MGRSKIFEFSGNNWSCPPAISCGLEVISAEMNSKTPALSQIQRPRGKPGNDMAFGNFTLQASPFRRDQPGLATCKCSKHTHQSKISALSLLTRRRFLARPNFLNKSQNSEPSISCSKTLESSQKGKGKKKRKKEMGYPKVKVRQQEDQDDHQPLTDFCFPEKEHEETPPTVVRIPESYVPSVVIPSISATEGEMKDNKVEEEIKQNIRASSIPRPRAVLSSPVNDTAIGSKNRIKAVRTPALKNHNLVKNNHTQSVPSHITENSKKAIKSKGASEGNSLKGRKGSETTLPSQRQPPRTGKPSSVGRQVSFSLD
ncbi:hypothetical protein FF1_022476 [Malus domestica]